jgi:hypothetical protein
MNDYRGKGVTVIKMIKTDKNNACAIGLFSHVPFSFSYANGCAARPVMWAASALLRDGGQ